MEYIEPIKSRQLYEMNRQRLIYEQNPYSIRNISLFHSLYYWLFQLKNFGRQIKDYNLIDRIDFSEYEQKACYKTTKIDVDYIPKVAVYTCILGGYDSLNEPLFKSEYCDFYAFTDFEIDSKSEWKRINPELYRSKAGGLNNIYINRWIKMHPHLLFPNYDFSLYIDGNVVIVSDIIPLLIKMLQENNFISIHQHWSRKLLQTEARAIKAKKKIDMSLLNKQIREYKANGYKDEIPLLEATIILRKHTDIRCIEVMDNWWSEFNRFVPRDQISLPYVLWKNGIKKENITFMGNNKYLNPCFYIMPHKLNS